MKTLPRRAALTSWGDFAATGASSFSSPAIQCPTGNIDDQAAASSSSSRSCPSRTDATAQPNNIMYFPKYWTKAKDQAIVAWGWSDHTLDEASGRAADRLLRIKAWVSQPTTTPLQGHYGYGDNRPLREEVLREFRTTEGRLRAVTTRNRYGCLVLNTADLMFVDVDINADVPTAKATGWLEDFLGSRTKVHAQKAFMDTLMGRVNDWVGRWPGWGWRVYRTAAGARLLTTHAAFEPDAPMTQSAFEVLKADPLYRRLCASQKCFRARLTPKPWRCDIPSPRESWPWTDANSEQRFRSWEAEYTKATTHYATCKLVGQFGNARIDPTFQALIELHDRATQADSDLNLA